MANVNTEKVGAMTRLVELLATIGSCLLIMITLPFSLCCLFKVVHEYERAVVFRMGRLKDGTHGPGKSGKLYRIALERIISMLERSTLVISIR